MGIDLVLAIIVGIVTWSVAAEGAWGAGLMLLAVVVSGLLAMNFFEPLADFMQANVSSGWHHRWDVICLVGLFALLVLGFRKASEYLAPTFIAVHPRIFNPARWACAALTGYVSMAFLLTALHTAPLPREFLGFRPERNNFFGIMAPDKQWLAFTQYVSEKSLPRGAGHVFDRSVVHLANQEKSQLTVSTFPIRYATRRTQLSAGLVGPSGSSGGSPGLQPRSTSPRPSGTSRGKTGF